MFTHSHTRLVIATLAVIAASLTACSTGAGDEEPAYPPAEVSIQFSWEHSIEFSGFYVAEDAGYYAEENISVDLQGGGYDAEGNYLDPIEAVISGKTDFGDMDAGVVLEARAAGEPLIAVASIYQRHPLALASLAENNIVRPEDLVGATVDIDYTSTVMYQALLTSRGIDPDSINTVPREDFTIDNLVNGGTDVIDAWVTNEIVELKLQGYEYNAILPTEYGIVVYPNVIFTTEDMIADNPDVVERFLRATVRGMQGAIEDPESAAALAVTYNENFTVEKETEAMFQSLPLLNPAGSPPGMMEASVWEGTQEIMLEQGILDEPIDLEAAYTLEFLDKIYAE